MWVVLGVENSLIVTTLSVKESEAVRKVVEVVEMVGWGGVGGGGGGGGAEERGECCLWVSEMLLILLCW